MRSPGRTNSSLVAWIAVTALLLPNSSAAQWYAGTWDSRLDGGMGHPATIAIRFEVEDAESGVAIQGAEVRLEGEFEERGFFRVRNEEFRTSAFTDENGIAVVGLSWHTHSPFEVRVDDIEKVQLMSVRSQRYEMFEAPFDLSHLIGDEAALWRLLMETPGIKYFYLEPGPDYRHYGDEASTHALFFEKVRDRDFDLDVTPVDSRSPWVVPFLSNPQAEAGPYLMIPYLVRLHCRTRRGC